MPKGKNPRSKKAQFFDSDSESGGESDHQPKNQYDATAGDRDGGSDLDDDDRLDSIEGSDDGDDGEDGEDWDEDDAMDDDQDVNEGDDCAYETIRKGRGMSKLTVGVEKEGESDDEDNVYEDLNADESVLNQNQFVPPEDRISIPVLLKYEKVRLLAERTSQLAQRAKPMIIGVDNMDPKVIAQLELEAKCIPIKIRRQRADGLKEEWKLSELKLKKEFIKYGFTNQEVDVKQINKRTKEIQDGGFITGMTNIHKSELAKIKPKSKGKSISNSKPTPVPTKKSAPAKKIKKAPKKSA